MFYLRYELYSVSSIHQIRFYLLTVSSLFILILESKTYFLGGDVQSELGLQAKLEVFGQDEPGSRESGEQGDHPGEGEALLPFSPQAGGHLPGDGPHLALLHSSPVEL